MAYSDLVVDDGKTTCSDSVQVASPHDEQLLLNRLCAACPRVFAFLEESCLEYLAAIAIDVVKEGQWSNRSLYNVYPNY